MVDIPRLIIGGLRGGSGKTVFTIGLLHELKKKGLKVLGFKKGPDFIDPGWLTLASGNPCRNLDAYIMDPQRLLTHFITKAMGYDIVIVEGNRGLFDGMDAKGSFSTSELAKTLSAPVCLLVDVTMATRTIAALVKGCQVFDPGLEIKAVVLNKVATPRQEHLIKSAIEEECNIPVVGSIPRQRENPFPERHMGLLPYQENEEALKAVEWAGRLAREHVDLERVKDIASSAPAMPLEGISLTEKRNTTPLKIGVLLDKAFWFYYPENLELLKALGAELSFIDSLSSSYIPEIYGLYIGGGFPETQAKALADNRVFREGLRRLINNGLPVYAECGGLIYLGKEVVFGGKTYPMLDVFPLRFEFESRPVGHGYTEFVAIRPNPYFQINRPIRGHEFHYSKPKIIHGQRLEFAFKVLRGNGFDGIQDGVIKGPVLGTYMHVHALGETQWAEGLVKLSQTFCEYSKKDF